MAKGSAEDLLTLTQWLSPAFPVGGFAYSHGLEMAIAEGRVADADALEAWLTTVLDRGSGRADAILLARAMDAGADHGALTARARALAASRERWVETRDQGQAFTDTVNAISGRDDTVAPMPVAVGRVAGGLGLAAKDVAALYLQAFASNLVTIGVRIIPLGQTEGQAVLARLRPLIARVAQDAAESPLEAIATAAFAADLDAMRHETADVRLFKT